MYREDPGRPPPAPQPAPRSRSHKLQPLDEQVPDHSADHDYDSRHQYDDYSDHRDHSSSRKNRVESGQGHQRYGGPMPNGELPKDQQPQSKAAYLQVSDECKKLYKLGSV